MTLSLRYWGWYALKILAATAATAGLYALLNRRLFHIEYPKLTQLTFDAVLFGFFLLPMVWVAFVVLAIRDQRFRCRACGRRLRMPVAEGSYSAMLLNSPGTEYVCPYGHGKLRLEYWVSTDTPPVWTKYGNIWQELFKPPRDV